MIHKKITYRIVFGLKFRFYRIKNNTDEKSGKDKRFEKKRLPLMRQPDSNEQFPIRICLQYRSIGQRLCWNNPTHCHTKI
jgi:hypothetical protein